MAARICTRRAGAALVETAICLPIALVLIMGTLEATRMMQLKQSLAISAYEGVRTALQPGADEAAVVADAQQVLTDRGVSGGSVAVTPSLSGVAVGELVRVTVSAPADAHAIVPPVFYAGATLSAQAEAMREYN